MYIIYKVTAAPKTELLVGHVGSNKYRAAAALRKYVELQVQSFEVAKGSTKSTSVRECPVANIAGENMSTTKLLGYYTVTTCGGMTIDLYNVAEEEIGWFRSVKVRNITHVATYQLREAKALDLLPKPASDMSQHDSLMGELQSVLKTRRST